MEEIISCEIESMDFPEKQIFVCYYYNQMTVDEIAREVGIDRKAVVRYLIDSSKKIIKLIDEGGIYYMALMSFLAMAEEATEVAQPKR